MLEPLAVTSSVFPVHRSQGTRVLAPWLLDETSNFLGDVYGETQRNENPVKQDFMIKYEPLDRPINCLLIFGKVFYLHYSAN